MARRDINVVDEVETVDEVTTESNETDAPAPAEEKAAEAPKAKRGDLPEGYVTPVGLAKAITERKLHTNKDGEIVELKPQMVYSYIKNAPKDHPFPLEVVTDSVGAQRDAVKLDEGLKWWTDRAELAKSRRENAAAKKAEKEAKAAKREADKVTEAEAAPAVAVTEAE